MADLAHWFSNDLSVSPTGDLLTVDGTPRGNQRLLRRLLTNPFSYYFHPEYGAGLQLYIGQPVETETLVAITRSQTLLEASVAQDPEPEIISFEIPNGFYERILYTDAETGEPTTLTFDINK